MCDWTQLPRRKKYTAPILLRHTNPRGGFLYKATSLPITYTTYYLLSLASLSFLVILYPGCWVALIYYIERL